MLKRLIATLASVAVTAVTFAAIAAPARAVDDNSTTAIVNSANAAAGIAVWENANLQSQGKARLADHYEGTDDCASYSLFQAAVYTSAVNADNDVLAHDPNAPGDLKYCGSPVAGQVVGYWYAGPQCNNWQYAAQAIIYALMTDPAHAAIMNESQYTWSAEGFGGYCSTSGNLYITGNFNQR